MRTRMAGRRTGTAVAVVLAVIVALGIAAVLRWLLGGNGHPFGDARACAGTELPLERALDSKGITLPPGATDVHYIARAGAPDGQLRLAVTFRSTRQAMNDYLTGLEPGVLDHIDEGPFTAGDVTDVPGLCGSTHPSGVLVPQRSATGQAFGVAVEVDRHAIRGTTEVVLTAPRVG
ncbi:hypothetical protein ACFVVX_33380 [Kitasatospora sp. NPDC058170]|uniref:hypothetical protein n=1 Tax=Kitasatospora sp. NPDC058170 TaxID=3346364 RepID=UPI0036D7988C